MVLAVSLDTSFFGHMGVSLVTKHKEHYEGEGGGFPKFELW